MEWFIGVSCCLLGMIAGAGLLAFSLRNAFRSFEW
jgi:hypothetical protein